MEFSQQHLLESDEDNCFNYTSLKTYSTPLTYVSSTLSILGSLLIIATFALWKDVRQSTSRQLLLLLAIADLGTGLGYLSAVSETLYYNENLDKMGLREYHKLCTAQSFFTTFFPVSSFFWTTMMGVYFLVALVFRRPYWSPKVIIGLNIIGWGLPGVFLVVMASIGVLGPTDNHGTSTAAAWCFVSNKLNGSVINTTNFKQYALFEGLCGKFWEMLSYFVVAGCYILILISYRIGSNKQPSSLFTRGYYYSVNNAMQNADIKLIVIPCLFIFLRMWGTIRYLYSTFKHNDCTLVEISDDCFHVKSTTCYYFLYSFTYYLQAFCDPAQGFGNAIFFVIFSKTIRARLIRVLHVIAYRLASLCTCKYSSSNDQENSVETTPLLDRRRNKSVTDSFYENSTNSSPVKISYRISDDDDDEDTIRYAGNSPAVK